MASISLSPTPTVTPTARREQRNTGWLIALSLPLLLFLLAPLASLLLRISPTQLLMYLFEPQVAQAVSLSIVTTTITLVITIIIGTPVGYLLARRSFRGRDLLDTLIDLPMVLPPAVAGIALLLAFGRRGIVGQYLAEWGIEIAFTQTAVVMAQMFVSAPFYVKAAVAGFSNIDLELEQAAGLDGANSVQTFSHITLPLAGSTLLGGAVMTWARALGEFGATIIFAGNFPGRTQTMPLAIYLGFELDLNIALTLSVILLVASFMVIFIVKGLLHQRIRF